jgi:ribosomal protein S18 acetylase RimI-like enzyme
VVTRGKVHRADLLPGFVVLLNGELKGLITFDLGGDECEIVTLNSLEENQGIGSMLVDEVRRAALRAGCARLWLVTTNDNLKAIRFYQRRGFELVAVHRRAVEASRRLKSGIPVEGIDGIPIRDEIELEMILR